PRARCAPADQHEWRPPVRKLHAGLGTHRRSRAPGARRMRRTPDPGLQGRAIHLRDQHLQFHHREELSMAYTKPLPAIDNWNRGFWAAAKEQRLTAQMCGDCGHVFFPPGACCPKCMSQKFTWKTLSGRGTVESWT